MDFQALLDQQLQSLEAASRAYDSGERAAALRLADPLRALFHQGGGASSLLSQLGGRYINMLSTTGDTPKHNPPRYAPKLVSWSLNPQESIFECAPKLATLKKQDRAVPFTFWWEGESIYQFDHIKVHRKDLVLHAANLLAEGTIEETFPARNRPLLDGEGWLATIRPAGGAERDVLVYHGHLASLRQIAHEVLNSPALRTRTERNSL
ncbi:MAG: hypothetical protein ABI353_16060 [Isosphaeraceae bacterium]